MRVQSPYAGQEPFSQTTPKDTVYRDKPSLKYKDINQAMGNAIYKQSHNPPSPTLPRQVYNTYLATVSSVSGRLLIYSTHTRAHTHTHTCKTHMSEVTDTHLRRRQTAKTWNATMKERNPLASSLTGETDLVFS